jgi:hypothetical protein
LGEAGFGEVALGGRFTCFDGFTCFGCFAGLGRFGWVGLAWLVRFAWLGVFFRLIRLDAPAKW